MKHLFVAGLMTIPFALGSPPAYADCGIESGSIRILANDFPALRTFTGVAADCESDSVEFVLNHTAEHSNIAVAAMTPDPRGIYRSHPRNEYPGHDDERGSGSADGRNWSKCMAMA